VLAKPRHAHLLRRRHPHPFVLSYGADIRDQLNTTAQIRHVSVVCVQHAHVRVNLPVAYPKPL
jgi:hypothetical protein